MKPSRHVTVTGGALAIVCSLLLTQIGVASAAATIEWERNLHPEILGLDFPYNDAFDPIVATHPANPNKIAVSYHYQPRSGSHCGIIPGLRLSVDGGATWHEAGHRPWANSGRYPNWHATIAWGPGPAAGSNRLYWADTTVTSCQFADHRLSVAYSDDLGQSWSPLFVYGAVPATAAGGYPDITVDRNPASPNYGVVYAAINWFASSSAEPGFRVIASSDGAHWIGREIPPLQPLDGYPFSHRIGYRLSTAPDGSLYATFCQRDRRTATGATGRLAYGIAKLTFDADSQILRGAAPTMVRKLAVNRYNLGTGPAPGTSSRQLLNACYSHGLDVSAAGTVLIALADYRTGITAADPRGVIRVGRSPDGGRSWTWRRVPFAATMNGHPQSAFRPTLVVGGGTVFVGLHLLIDVPLGTSYSSNAKVANAFTVSTDGGATFGVPRLISASHWHPDWLSQARNGPGLRDRAELTADGRVVYVYGDGRNAAAQPDPRWGRAQIYGAMISP